MGIPSFARTIVEKYKNTHSPVTNDRVEHLFIDFNCIVYNCFAALDKSTKKQTWSNIEAALIKSVVIFLRRIIEVVEPQQSVYIAVDGSAPCAKVQQQRFRRFKTIFMSETKTRILLKHGEVEDCSWNTSCNIAPGTKFMTKLSKAIEAHIISGHFSQYADHKIKFVFSDSNIPGEGEHKYMDLIRELESNAPLDQIVVYSPDADVIVLSLGSHKKNINVLRSTSEMDATRTAYEGDEFYYLNIDNIRAVFLREMLQSNHTNQYDVKRVITDYVLLTTFAGNDFVVPIPYLKIRLDHKTPMRIYKNLLPQHDDYLVKIDSNGDYSLNSAFFKEFVKEISLTEESKMRSIQKGIHRERRTQSLSKRDHVAEKGMLPHQRELARLEHKPFFSRFNPLYRKYNKEFDKLNFFQATDVWKRQYYEYFLGPRPEGEMDKMVLNYMESLLFVVNYYFKGVPSWTWHYKYRVAPLPSDILTRVQDKADVNDGVVFELGTPLKPLNQLMLILPPQMASIMPKAYQKLMLLNGSPIKDMYPTSFELDVYPGQKLIYTEPLLPEIDVRRVVEATKAVEYLLSKPERERNVVRSAPVELTV